MMPAKTLGFCPKHYQADYHRRHREKRIAAARAYQLAHLEQVRATKRAYYQAHKDEHRIRMDRWRAANREHNLELMRRWGRLNRDRKNLLEQVRRDAIRANLFLVTTADLSQIIRRQEDRCAYCFRRFDAEAVVREWDHIIPISRGGRHSIGNLVAACRGCNASKGSSYVTEWRARQRRLEGVKS